MYIRRYCIIIYLTGLLAFSARLAHTETNANYACSKCDCSYNEHQKAHQTPQYEGDGHAIVFCCGCISSCAYIVCCIVYKG